MTIFNYTVNYIDVAVIFIIIAAIAHGWKRGLALSVANFIRWSVGMSLCFYFSSNFSQNIYNSFVRPYLLNQINEKIVTSKNIDEIITNLNTFGSGIPTSLKQFMNFKSIDISSKDISESILTGVFEPVALPVTKAAVFLAVFVLFFGATAIIMHIVKKSANKKRKHNGKESTLKKADRLFGSVFGLLKATVLLLAITSVLMYILNLDGTVVNRSTFMKEVSNSSLIKYINNINPFNAITEGLI